ncbi:hypothetical protein M8J77_009814 [Diaphorina citri]|nr:hypothetical protein M8J77_009814 [Diaphorina citri]
MQPADAAVSRRMNISWYAVKWRRHALTQISLRQMRGQFTSQTSGEERFDEKEEDMESHEKKTGGFSTQESNIFPSSTDSQVVVMYRFGEGKVGKLKLPLPCQTRETMSCLNYSELISTRYITTT